jgi:hypothetical protein
LKEQSEALDKEITKMQEDYAAQEKAAVDKEKERADAEGKSDADRDERADQEAREREALDRALGE